MFKLKSIKQQQKGFTLLEVLLVVAIIAILAGIVIIAINPGKNLGDTRNSQRSADVSTILNGTYQYSLDNSGTLPSGITTTATEICATGAASCTGLVDLQIPGRYSERSPMCYYLCSQRYRLQD
jgi:type IV pilus assembly protein PilA